MEDTTTKSEKLTDHIGQFLDTYYKLTVVKVTEKVSELSSGGFMALAMCIFGSLVLFFLGLGCAAWIGNAINNRTAGYFIVAGIFILCLSILFLLRKKFIFPIIRNIIVRKIYE